MKFSVAKSELYNSLHKIIGVFRRKPPLRFSIAC
jgi:hypothetical protein